MKQERDLAVDCAKTIGILSVLTVHATSDIYTQSVDGNWLIGHFFGSAARAGVFLFLMCTGVLFLKSSKEISIKRMLCKYIPRLLAALFFWAAVYKCYSLYITDSFCAASVGSALIELLRFDHHFHLYYLHIALIVYLFLPVVKVFTANADQKTCKYALGLWFLLGILYPVLLNFWPFSTLTGVPLQWSINNVYSGIGYCMFGHYLDEHPLRPKTAVCFCAVGFSVIYFGTLALYLREGYSDNVFQLLGVFFLAGGIFSLCRAWEGKIGNAARKVITYISKASFCIYLVHMLFLHTFLRAGFNANTLPCIVSIPMLVLACFAMSIAAYYILSRIPVIKKWVI